MKKIYIITILAISFATNSFANTIKLESEIKLNVEILYTDQHKDLNADASLSYIANKGPGIPSLLQDMLKKMDDCNQVQMDIASTYAPIYGVDRANSMALGAFIGCMGY